MQREKKPLYRKVNTLARGVWHGKGKHYRHQRNTKIPEERMRQGANRGLDYTPLFRFLLSKVGQDWDAVHREAMSRLDKDWDFDERNPIWWMVDREGDRPAFVRISENSFYSGLYVDDGGKLQKVDPNFNPKSIYKLYPCSTHSFNGKPF